LEQLSEGKKKYFYAQMFGYVLGLVTTVIMMIQFKAAQPALLYLVPV
jgi:minor histocompatibility antigen H13